MQAPDPLDATERFGSIAESLVNRLAPVRVVAARGWWLFADALGLHLTDGDASSVIVVGPPAFVLKYAATAETEFGFVMPVAQTTKRWQRAQSWRDDATLDLWRAGWSPVAVDRLVIATHVAEIEFAVGNARPTPSLVESALDDPD